MFINSSITFHNQIKYQGLNLAFRGTSNPKAITTSFRHSNQALSNKKPKITSLIHKSWTLRASIDVHLLYLHIIYLNQFILK